MKKVLAMRKRPEALVVAPQTVVFTEDERQQVREAAFLSDQSASAFIRAAAVKAAQRVARQTLKALDRAA